MKNKILCILLLCCGFSFAQQLSVTGNVKDSTGEPLPGVNVVVKGTNTGVQTDFDGNYKISVNKGAVLIFSYVGMEPIEVVIGDKTKVNVILNADLGLDEVLVVGYGTKSKSTLTGSVAAVKGAELDKAPVVEMSNALQGRIPGLFVRQTGSEPGQGAAVILIRGLSTFKNSAPLVVIDGVPGRQGGLNRLNPADIESVTVLKDASAAIYGSRAANGVILVTTKKGKTGKVSFSYTSNVGMSSPISLPKMMSAYQYLEALNDVTIYDNVPADKWKVAQAAFRSKDTYVYKNAAGDDVTVNPFATQARIKGHRNNEDPWKYPNTDWYAEVIRPYSMQTRNTMQVSGGTEKLNFYSSMGHLFQDGNYKKTATYYNQYDYRLNVGSQLNSAIKLSSGLIYRQEMRKYPVRSAGNIFGNLIQGKPYLPAWWPNGKPGPDIENGDNPAVTSTSAGGGFNSSDGYLQTTFNVDVNILEGLTAKLTAAIDKNFYKSRTFRKPWYLYSWDGSTYEKDDKGNPTKTPKLERGKKGFSSPELDVRYSNTTSTLYQGTLQYQKTFAQKHDFTVLLGANQEYSHYETVSAFRKGFISNKIEQIFAGADDEKDNGGYASETARMSYFGRLNYAFDKKYLVEFILRYDGSYLFPEKGRFGTFPGASVGWVASRETFIKNALPFVSFLKFKGSYGELGNDNDVGAFQYLSAYNFTTYITDGVTRKTVREGRLPNEDITWEVAKSLNIGLESRFLQDKLSVEIEYFKNVRDKILSYPYATLPDFTGIPASEKNIGKFENQGVDFSVSYDDRINQDWSYGVSVTGQWARNKLVYWDEAVPDRKDYDSDKAYAYRMEVFNRQRAEGRPYGTNLLYKYKGVFKTQAEIDANQKLVDAWKGADGNGKYNGNGGIDYSELKSRGLQPGDMKYEDTNGDGKITPDDRSRTDANATHPLQASLSLRMTYKGFDISVLFQGMFGAERVVTFTRVGRIGNYPAHFYNRRWTIDNPSSVHPRAITERGNQYWASGNTYWIEDTDFIRLRQLQIGYNVPESITKILRLDGLRIFFNGTNLYTLTDAYYDPEGQTRTSYPITKVMNLGLNIKF